MTKINLANLLPNFAVGRWRIVFSLFLLLSLFTNVLLSASIASAAPPVAGDDSYSTNEDTVLNVPAPGLLQNDSDPENDPVVFFIASAPGNGSFSVSSANDGSFSYTPGPNFNGVVTIGYRLYDGTAFSNLATITITVNPVNDKPVATNDSYMAVSGQSLAIAAPGVLGNDSDVDNATLTATLTSNVSNGTLVLNLDGSFSYTSTPGFSGMDSFSYVAFDGTEASNEAVVTINVVNTNQPPVAANDSYTTAQNSGLNIAAPGVLANDSDPNNNPLTTQLVSTTANGSLTLNPNGSFSYTPNPLFSGTDSFVYRAFDGLVPSANATVVITVVPDTLPLISIANATTTEGNTGTTNLTFQVTLSKTSLQSVTVNYATSNGTATAGSDYSAASGTLTFAPGETSKPVVVPVIGDVLVETDETFKVTLSNPANGFLAVTEATGTILDDDVETPTPGKPVVKIIRPADLILQLRVTPDRAFATNGGSSNWLSYQLSVKNIGPGKATRNFSKIALDAKLTIAFATFSNPQAWVEKIESENGTDYLYIRYPDFAPDEAMTSTIVFRAKSDAMPGRITTRVKNVWNDESAAGRSASSNAVHLALVSGDSNRNETGGEVQFFGLVAEESVGKNLVLAADFFAPEERVDFWYTDSTGNSKKLENSEIRADKEGFIKLKINLEKASFQVGQTYIFAGYGARSGVYASLVVEFSAAENKTLTTQVRLPGASDYRLFAKEPR